MRSLTTLVLLFTVATSAFSADNKAKAVAVAKAACACAEPAAKETKAAQVAKALVACSVTAECKCRSGGECTCVQCKCSDAVAAKETPVTETARFILVTSTTCPPCHAMKANVVPELSKTVEVTTVDGGYGATMFPTIIYEVNGKEKWRTTGYTSAQTLLSLRGS